VSRFDAGGALVSDTMAVQGPIGDDARYDLIGVYGQYVWEATPDLDITLGARYTYAKADIGRLDDGAGNPTSAERDWDQATFNLRASHRLTDHWQVFGGVSEAFRAPNVDDLSALKSSRSDLISTGSLGVEPESYLTYEIGTRYADEDLVTHAAVFYTDIDDVITSRPIGTDPMTGEVITTTTNGSDGHLWGAEAAAAWRFRPQWTVSGYVAYVDGEADTYPTSSLVPVREPVSRLMPLTASVALRWDEPLGKVWVEGRVTAADRADRLTSGDRDDTSRIPPGGTPGYYVVQIDSGYQANSNLELFLTLENVTDTAYRIHGSGLNQPGFNAIVGARLTW
jgi:hemoglobin/transferrin/lactoferrin receptor protein